ncbi:PVC-type heme-binding CxxCH protein [Flavihumibacter profundi]|uniref:PVC-type heme-binding CxxCH protein n=1 Tax=Flavihumibacter profundi TaxID=2716883 RepID=UPI001CC592F2|nr:PVC-type heme-binding CxxCH protein [Flavihumibacter profundi]MBZ5855529.1 c-type cytochrome [Flavihumibacter profundi]
MGIIFKKQLYLLLTILLMAGCHNRHDKPVANNQGLRPEDALSSFELEPGFKIELLAAEPLISDPVDMEIDEYGRLYVVEMHGYPLDKTGSGVIKLLYDTNGDGQLDKSTVFADGLTLPNSIMRWKKGVIITDAPNVLYFEDTNNDGKADIKDTLLTGFALSNPQHNLNSPVLGMDNWIYLGHEGAVATQTYQKEFGDEGTEIYYPAQPNGPRLDKNASGRSVRFRPDQHLLETTSSITQFGHTFDQWGHHLLVTNANHIIQEVMPATYLKRNPYLVVTDATESLSDHGNAAEVFPITKNPEHQLLTDIGVITSACGLTAYLGGAFPAPFNNASFVAEPVSNLVHVDRLTEKGASFIASRIHPHKEFLASTDAWFRPVNMYIGPDGALYVVDYYREIIEHPEWMGEDVVKSGKLYNGHDMGRIYRITPTGTKAADWTKGLKLGDATSEQLVAQLANPNIWWRLNAQRLLVDRKDKSVLHALEQMAQNPKAPLGRLHALWTLEGIDALTPQIIEGALKDNQPGVRENAIKLAELHLDAAPGLSKALFSLQDDTDAKVKFQLLCTLGSVNSPEALTARNKLLFKDINDEWVQLAALSGATANTESLLNIVLDSFHKGMPAYISLVHRISAIIGGSGNAAVIHRLIKKAVNVQDGDWPAPLLAGLAQGLQSQKTPAAFTGEQDILVKTFFDHPSADTRKACLDLLKVMGMPNVASKNEAIKKAMAIVVDEHQPEDKRVECIRFLALGNPAPYADQLKKLIAPFERSSIQVAAVYTLSNIPDTIATHYLLTQWNNLTPEIQDAAMNTFLEDDRRVAMLLNAIEAGIVQPASVGWQRSVQLMAQSNLKLREKARLLLTKTEAEAEKVNKAYQQSLTMNGDIAKGKTVFQKNCATCHQVRGEMGISFGPDLGTVHNWSVDAIMANILAPNLSISSGFDLWEVVQTNGETFQGIIASETATAIKLKNAIAEERMINRTDIKSLRALNMSAMTSGLEKQVNQQQMADLLAFLKQNR